MNAVCAMRLPLSHDLSAFVQRLRDWQVPCRVTEEAGEQVLWVSNEVLAQQVRDAYQAFSQGQLSEPIAVAQPVEHKLDLWAHFLAAPITYALLFLTFTVAFITLLGDNWVAVAWFNFVDFKVQGPYAYFQAWQPEQAWRLVSPMLVHFGWLHLAMNSLWIWELGRRVEGRQGSIYLLVLVLVFAAVSNSAQYLWAGPAIFGGLSGVLYGLLGHCWLFQRLAPCEHYQLPRGVVAMMLIWLVVCMTGIFGVLGLGAIANAAHLGGLVVGCISGVLGGWWTRRR